MSKLTAKQEKFKDNIIAGLKPSAAYKKAGYSSRMGVTAVSVEANRLMKNPKIALAIDHGQKKLADKAIWTREQALQMLAEIAIIGKSHMVFEKTIKNIDENGEEKTEEKEYFDPAAANSMIKAIEQANKMCGYNEPDKIDVTNDITVVFGGAEKWAK